MLERVYKAVATKLTCSSKMIVSVRTDDYHAESAFGLHGIASEPRMRRPSTDKYSNHIERHSSFMNLQKPKGTRAMTWTRR